MKPAGSIRARLLRTQLLWSLLWGLALVGAIWLAVQHEVDELLDDTLRSAAEGLIGPMVEPVLAARAAAGGASASASAADAALAAAAGGPRFVWQLVAPGPMPVLLASARGAPAQALHTTPQAGFADVQAWRVYGLALGHDGHMLYVAQARDDRTEAKLELLFAAALASLPMGMLGLLWLNSRIRQDLQPLQALSQRLTDYDPLRPGATLGQADDVELRPVHTAIDALALRLARRVEHERGFASHAAHALRTPLAGIDAQLAVALREAPAALQPRLQRLRAASSRLQRVVASLLAFFRSGAEVERRPILMPALMARLPGTGPGGVSLHMQPGQPLVGDIDLLTAVLLNLLDNAAAHGASTVTLATPEPGVLTVQDDGAGVTPERLQALQQALDAQDYAGRTGLGLMLADMVARAHGGACTLLNAGPGFTVRLRLQRLA